MSNIVEARTKLLKPPKKLNRDSLYMLRVITYCKIDPFKLNKKGDSFYNVDLSPDLDKCVNDKYIKNPSKISDWVLLENKNISV